MTSNTPQTKAEEWEKTFDKTWTRQDSDGEYRERLRIKENCTPKDIKYFIRSLLSAQREKVIHECVEASMPLRIVDKEPFVDYPLAWEIVEQTKKENHHEKCSWRVACLLCDCAVLDGILPTLKHVHAALSQLLTPKE